MVFLPQAVEGELANDFKVGIGKIKDFSSSANSIGKYEGILPINSFNLITYKWENLRCLHSLIVHFI